MFCSPSSSSLSSSSSLLSCAVFVHWCTGLATVSLTTAAVHHGVDVVHALASVPFLPVDEGSASLITGKASCVAGAMLLNTLSLPVRLYLLSIYGERAFAALEQQQGILRRELLSWHRKSLRADPSQRRLERRGGE